MRQLIFSHLGTIDLLIVLMTMFIAVVLCVIRAKKLNRNVFIWGILGLFFNCFAVLVIYLLPKQEEKK